MAYNALSPSVVSLCRPAKSKDQIHGLFFCTSIIINISLAPLKLGPSNAISFHHFSHRLKATIAQATPGHSVTQTAEYPINLDHVSFAFLYAIYACFYFPTHRPDTSLSTPPSTARISPLTYLFLASINCIVVSTSTNLTYLTNTYNCHGHLLIASCPFRWHVSFCLHLVRLKNALLVFPALFSRHFTWEVAWRDAVDSDI